MKIIPILIILLVTSTVLPQSDTSSSNQDTIKTKHFRWSHGVNFRDPLNEDNPIDWHISMSFLAEFDSLMGLETEIKGTYERDNGIKYYSHSERLGFRYGCISYIRDTEDSINLFSVSAFYPFLKYFRAGVDLSWMHHEEKYGAYIGFKAKFGSAEIVFWDELRRIKGEISHKFPIGKKKIFFIGLKANALYLGGKKFDWNAGYTAEFQLNI